MSQENFYVGKMTLKKDDELKNYIDNQDHFHEDAVLAAIIELEKRAIEVVGVEKIKEELTALKTIKEVEKIEEAPTQTQTTALPLLYSTTFILIFGLFTLLGGSILMALNFVQLKNIKAARNVIIASLAYSFLSAIILQSLGITNMVVSLLISVLGIYLLYDLIYKKQFPQNIENFTPRNIAIPILISLLVSIPLLYLLAATGNLPQ